MAAALQSFIIHRNPNPNFYGKGAPRALFHLSYSSFIPSESIIARRQVDSTRFFLSERRFGTRILPIDRRISKLVPLAAPHEDSKHSDIEVDNVKELDIKAEESQEAWKQMLESFKEEAIKMQAMSQDAYEVYSKKAIVVLKETSEKLKIQADIASRDLTIIAKEISEEGKVYLSSAAENPPDSVKDIVETFSSSTNEVKEMSAIRDFYLGIPYGAFLAIGGFVSFMLTGDVSAIRFGVILGSALLALSVSSLRSWRSGQSSTLFLKGQAG